MTLKCSVTLADLLFQTADQYFAPERNGCQIMDVEVVLGSEELGSSCKITLSDPGHIIAERLINHSLSKGGILDLGGQIAPVEPVTTNAASVPGVPKDTKGVTPTGQMAATGAEFTPSVKAFLDTVAKRETQDAKDGNWAQSYYAKNGSGYFTDADIKAGNGFPLSQGETQNIGRYQVNRGDWRDAQKYYKRKLGFSPVDQDLIGYWKLGYREALKPLAAGDLGTAINKAGHEWASLPGSQYPKQIQAGTTLKEYTDYYAQRLAFYQGKQAPVVPAKTQTIVKPSKATTTPVAQKPAHPAQSSTGLPVIKGSIITINIEGTQFDFYHQGTEMSQEGITVITGQGVRWALSRRKRSRTFKSLSLRTLAEIVAHDHGVKLDYQATIDPEYSHLDQSEISDYQFLLREIKAYGLLMTEGKGTIVIKERKQLAPSTLLLQRGYNLISYQIADKAMGTHDDAVSKMLPQEAKSAIDPIAGKVVSSGPDVDRNTGSNSVTGKKPATKGTLSQGAANQTLERGKTKRVSGLPSVFTIPLSLETLQLTPLGTCVTNGFPGILDRIWVIKDISHVLGTNETVLSLVSPVEVADDPVVTPVATATSAATRTPISANGWVYPATGITKSLYGPRPAPVSGASTNHKGTDIANAANVPIYAARAGTVIMNQTYGGGGNYIRLQHEGALFTEYMHMASLSPLNIGVQVKMGDPIGIMGQTGNVSGIHLHFGILQGEARINPASVFKKLAKRDVAITALEAA